MKRLMVVLLGLTVLLLPFAGQVEARGGRGRGIGGGAGARGRRHSSRKSEAEKARQVQSERGDSLLDGLSRRRSL